MPKFLVDLPPNLIDQILSYDDTSHLSLPLWLTGDKTLQTLLSDSVTHVELRSPGLFECARLPKYLTNLHSLRHLLIDRFYFSTYGLLYDPARTLEVIAGLPSTLESLRLRFCYSKDLFFPSSSLAAPRAPTAEPTLTHISLRDKFPALTCLELDLYQVWTPPEVKALPRSLTELWVGLDPTPPVALNTMTCMPPEITSLVIYCTCAEAVISQTFFERLPPHTRKLLAFLPYRLDPNQPRFTNAIDDRFLSVIPRSITQVGFIYNTYFDLPKGRQGMDGITYIDLASFKWDFSAGPVAPPYLSEVGLCYLPKKDAIKLLTTFPENLTSLIVAMDPLKPKYIRALPRSLEKLNCYLKNTSRLKIGDFPPALKSFTIGYCHEDLKPSFFSSLPLLTTLKMDSAISMKCLSFMPRTLTTLNVQINDLEENIEFPPALTHLRVRARGMAIWEKSELDKKRKKRLEKVPHWLVLPAKPGVRALKTFPLAALPRSLKHLDLPSDSIPASSLPHLPPRLTSLYFRHVVLDAQFNPKDPELILAARHFVKEARETEEYDYCPSGNPNEPHVSFFDLLPRTLTDFKTEVPTLPLTDYSRIPKGLTSLSLNGNTHPDFILHMPTIPRLRYFSFGASGLENAHLALLEHIPILEPICKQTNVTADAAFKVRSYTVLPSWFKFRDQAEVDAWRILLDELYLAAQDPSGQSLLNILAEKRGT